MSNKPDEETDEPLIADHRNLSLPEIKSGRTDDAIRPGAAWQ